MKNVKKLLLVGMCIATFSTALLGCGQEAENEAETSDTQKGNDAYEDYIHAALEAVKDSAQVIDNGNAVSEDGNQNENANDSGKVTEVVRSDQDDNPSSEQVYVSSEVADNNDDVSTSESPQADDNTGEKKTTPATFEVGTGLVYIDGKYDQSYMTNLLKTINDARTGLNYPEMTINESLNTCANLRAKEITCFLSHMRPDGSMFYSLAPDYYKAEIITIDSADPKETFDAWMTDPVSRGILFSEDYTTMGASNYICNGLNCIVVSFGY